MTTNAYSNNLNAYNGPKGNLADYNHASRLFVSSNLKFAPKTKYLYHTYFSIDPNVGNTIQALVEKYGIEIGLLVKMADLPKFQATVETRKKYNRTKHMQTAIQYQPVTITFHDDNHGVTTALLEAYYRYYYADAWYGDEAGAYNKAGDGDNTYKGRERNQFRYGLDNSLSVPFFRNIQISQLSRSQYTTYTLVNPIITNWEHDQVDSADNGTFMQNTITLQYEAVHYSRGSVEVGADGNPTGFGVAHYDTQPSPLNVPLASSIDTDLLANLNSPEYRDNDPNIDYDNGPLTYLSDAFNSLYSSISQITNVDNISGLQDIIIPKTRGAGGQQSVTTATSSKITSRSTNTSSSKSFDELSNNPEALDSLAKILFLADFLSNGGDGVNNLQSAWASLPATLKESYKKKVLEDAE
jgi:hypothetical protein